MINDIDKAIPMVVDDSRRLEWSLTLAKLKSHYSRRLPSRLDELASAIAEARGAPGELRHLQKVRLLSHRICGTAGSYGFPLVGNEARRIEKAVDRLDQPGIEDTAATWQLIEEALAIARSLSMRPDVTR